MLYFLSILLSVTGIILGGDMDNSPFFDTAILKDPKAITYHLLGAGATLQSVVTADGEVIPYCHASWTQKKHIDNLYAGLLVVSL